MAFTFASGSSHLTASIGLGAAPLTLFARFNPTTLNADMVLLMSYAVAAANGVSERYLQQKNTAGNPFLMIVEDAGVGADVITFSPSGVTTGAWFVGIGRIASATSRTLRVETTNTSGSGASLSDSAPDTIRVAQYRTDGGPNFTGQVADVAAWTADLTDAECESLRKGFPPHRVRPQSLVSALRLIRSTNDRKGFSWTTSGAPSVSAHPRSYGF